VGTCLSWGRSVEAEGLEVREGFTDPAVWDDFCACIEERGDVAVVGSGEGDTGFCGSEFGLKV